MKKQKKKEIETLTIRDYAEIIDDMHPDELYLNHMLIWSRNKKDPMAWYYKILHKNLIVQKIICDMSESELIKVYIYTLKGVKHAIQRKISRSKFAR